MTASKNLIQAAAGVGGNFYPYTIDNSARFNDDDSAYLYRTPSSAGSQDATTISVWVKRANQGALQNIFWQGNASEGNHNNSTYAYWQADNSLQFISETGGSAVGRVETTPLYRDSSAWYHLVFVYDSANATTNDRMRIYVNGERVTALDINTMPSQNADSQFNRTDRELRLGRGVGAYADCYFSEFVLVDGSALDPTSFGESKNGVWIPKRPSVTYGTNGFYLNFGNSAALGTDSSSNGNNFTVSGLNSNDQMIDTPTNSFMNITGITPRRTGGVTYALPVSDGGLAAGNSSGGAATACPIPKSGKWYFEVKGRDTDVYGFYFSVQTNTYSSFEGQGSDSDDEVMYWILNSTNASVRVYSGGSWSASGNVSGSTGTIGNSDILAFAVDMDNGTCKAYVNGTLDHSVTWSSANFSRKDVRLRLQSDYRIVDLNFGQNGTFNGQTTAGGNSDGNGYGDFKYAPPSGYLAICTQNMTEPAIGPNIDANSSGTTSDEHFNTVLYTGTGSSLAITGVGFQPDFTWIKRRSASEYHWLVDVLRGVTTGLRLPGYSGETTLSDATTSFDSDGFTAGPGSGYTGASGNTYVAWNWKAGGSGVSNTDGSITSTVSANTDAGFSVVLYTGTGASMTFGHGLGQALDFLILTKRTGDNYIVYPFVTTGNLTNYLQLETTSAYSSDSVCHTNSSTVIGFNASGARNTNGVNYVAYCFAEVEGFSSFGYYRGNGITDGPFVHTGFRPAWLLIKRTDTSGYEWVLFDDKRLGYNETRTYLRPTSTAAEVTDSGAAGSWAIDLLSNGFKLRSTSEPTINAFGAGFIYMAFAENPFKYANAR